MVVRTAPRPPTVVLLVGVNGVGKTTTLARLAHRLRERGETVLLAAADTFRAGAIEQVREWGTRLDVPVVAAACIVLFVLVIARLHGVVADLRRTLAMKVVLGKADASGDTPSRRRIFVCRPEPPLTGAAEEACATRIVTALLRRAYRGPATQADTQRLISSGSACSSWTDTSGYFVLNA